MIKGSGWNFDNSYSRLPKIFYASQKLNPVESPELIVLNEPLAASLGLDANALRDDVSVFGGNESPEGAFPLAQAYAGHQFGYFAMLGDGRAMLLGEQITPSGERFDIQLKGSGRTPFSRGGDGRAAVGPMLREYIISEAMHALGIPTTRSLAVVETGEPVHRETVLPGAILTRVAASHIRVGTFQYAAKWGSVDDLRALADYTINRHYPEISSESNKYLLFLKEVIKRQASLISKWMLVGFIHGVMNTDNMAISGETIDYGPCAFMDTYNEKTVFSSIDREGRYAYGNQPYIGGWNLARLAETLLPLLHENEQQAVDIAQEEIARFIKLYHDNWLSGMRRKLGISNEEEEDESLAEDLLGIMEKYRADYTNTFRTLTLGKHEGGIFGTPEFSEWHERWQARLGRQDSNSWEKLMRDNNPSVIPRNHRVEEALEAASNGDYRVMEKLLDVLSSPYVYAVDHEEYCTVPGPSNIPYKTYCGT